LASELPPFASRKSMTRKKYRYSDWCVAQQA
jgi:hypothetical protein